MSTLVEKIISRQAVISIVGLGYVGLPLLLRFQEVGFATIGLDADVAKIEQLAQAKSYIKHISSERIQEVMRAGNCEWSNDMSAIGRADVIILCVPTPLDCRRVPDMSYVQGVIRDILPHLRPGQLISLESTTYPGTTEEEMVAPIVKKGFRVGEDIFLVYSPEREDPGNPVYGAHNTPKVVGGVTEACREAGLQLYSTITSKVVPVSSVKVAELTKLLENIYRAVNIGLMNEMKIVADKMGIDIWEVIDAAATKPFGFVPFYPGPGWGGHCIPIDPFYLAWKAREYDVDARFIELAGEINTAMPEWVVHKITDALGSHRKAVKGSKILVLGVAYKKNVDDIRESPSIRIMELLYERGADLHYADDFVPSVRIKPYRCQTPSYLTFAASPVTAQMLQEMDCVIVSTDHDTFDYEYICCHSPLIVDLRGRYREVRENVVKA